MSMEAVRKHLKKYGLDNKIREFSESTATVEEAAEVNSCEPARIAKSLSFIINDKDLAILAGSQELTFAASSTVAVDSLNSLILLSKPNFSKCFLTASIDIFTPPKLL